MEKSAILQASMKNLEWFRDNYEKLKKDHDKQWVIIEGQGVVTSSSTYDEIMKADAKNKKSALVEYVDSEQLAMFF
jgi:Family of unknown function (DUF5678)